MILFFSFHQWNETEWNAKLVVAWLQTSSPAQHGCLSGYFCHLLVNFVSKQLGPRSGKAEHRSWSGSKPSDTLIVFLKEFFEKVNIEKSVNDNKSMTNYLVCWELTLYLIETPFIAFANRADPDQAACVGPDLDPNPLTLW